MRRQIGGVEYVLERDRQAGERQRRQARVCGGAARRVEIERDKGADLALARGNGLGAQLDDGAGLEFAGLDAAGKIERGKHPGPFAFVPMWPERRARIKGHG